MREGSVYSEIVMTNVMNIHDYLAFKSPVVFLNKLRRGYLLLFDNKIDRKNKVNRSYKGCRMSNVH